MVKILYFTAKWCGPCQVLAPIMEQIGNELPTAQIEKIDVDADRNTANYYQVTSVPTLIFLKEGKVVDRRVGMQPKKHLTEMINRLA